MNKMGRRKVYIDEIAGILIFVMVMVHITARADIFGLNHRLLILFYYFMPWFYFKSGFLSKNINSNVPIIKNAVIKSFMFILFRVCSFISSFCYMFWKYTIMVFVIPIYRKNPCSVYI